MNAPLVTDVPKISDRWSADDGFAWSYTEQVHYTDWACIVFTIASVVFAFGVLLFR